LISAIGSAVVAGAALGAGLGAAKGISAKDQAVIAELRQTDREVRAHEAAHLAAAGGLARGVNFSYVTGPDGQQYAVAGEVHLDVSPESGDPEATIRKAEQIRAAANAPANPSGQDRQVAAQAAQMALAAQQELAEQRQKQQDEARAASVSQYERSVSDSGNELLSTLTALA
jgi:hypothetical protein